MNAELQHLGWSEAWQSAWDELGANHLTVGRIVADYGLVYRVALPAEVDAEVSGRLQHVSAQHALPKIGDWVGVQMTDTSHAVIHEILPRASEISRRRPGKLLEKQVLAANVDVAFLVQALDHDFSPERLRRYIFQLQKDDIQPVIVLNKSDKVTDAAAMFEKLAGFDCEVLVTSAIENKGITALAERVLPGMTAVFLGSSGVGKSTITNMLLASARQATQNIREADSKGRHTTTHRELFVLANGGLIIDTPGLRELRLWGSEADLSALFPTIQRLSEQCQFSNCGHTVEPGCAVLAARASGELSEADLAHYRAFQDELHVLHARTDTEAVGRKKSAGQHPRSSKQVRSKRH